MKSMVWPLENGLELRMESDGDKLTLRIVGGEIAVRELSLDETFVAFGNQITEQGSLTRLEVTKGKT